MRTVAQPLLDAVTQPKTVDARLTFRKRLPVFSTVSLTDSLGLTDPANIDACNWNTGLLRIVNHNNTLYTQYVSDVGNPWPAWTNQGIALKAGSVPAVDAGYVWYQKSSGAICRRYYGTWGTEVSVLTLSTTAVAVAPLADKGYIFHLASNLYQLWAAGDGDSNAYYLYGLSALPRIDVVSLNGKEYFYTMDRDEGRIIEIQHSGNAVLGKDSYGVGKAIVPIDAIDEDYGLLMGYANVIDGKVVVTGHLTRTSDDTPVSMDVYCMGPEYFSLGREMFIQSDYHINGKLLLVGSKLVVPGAQHFAIADATSLFGYDHAALKLQTSDLASITLNEAEGRSSTLDLDLSTDLSHVAIDKGNEVTVEMAYNDNWCQLAKCDVDELQRTEGEAGESFGVRAVGQSAKRLAAWSPEQGLYIPSMASIYDNPATLTSVVRVTGKWESTNPSDPTAPIKLRDLNKLGVLYSTARASRGGVMRGKFFYPSDAYLTPFYGVATNYYRETAVEAAERLGVEVNDLDEDMFGHNGLLAAYGAGSHSGGPGVALWLWENNVMTKLTSVSLTIPANTWHWLQIEFIEGEIRVKYRLDSSAAWTELFIHTYNQAQLPWKRETFGRGAIVAQNITPSVQYWGLSSTDLTLGVENNLALPSSGTLLIDNEQITYSGRSSFNIADLNPGFNSLWQVKFEKRYQVNPAFNVGTRVVTSMVTGWPDHSFANAAAVFTTHPTDLSFGAGNTFRIVDYDADVGYEWSPTTYQAGWSNYIGLSGYGSWVPVSFMMGVFLNPNPWNHITSLSDMDGYGPCSFFRIKPSYLLTARGANGTSAVGHGDGTAHWYVDKSVQCAMAASFTQDEDQSMEEALKTIVHLSGGEVSCQAVVDESHVFASPGLVAVTNDHKNFIATLDIPSLLTDKGVGICFRSADPFAMSASWPTSTGDGYYLEVALSGGVYYLDLYDEGPETLIERVPLRPISNGTNDDVPVGTLKVSVQDSRFTVWLNGRYIHTFYSDLHPEGVHIAFVSRQAATFRIRLSELDDLLADIVVGTRGNGMSVLSELLADRHILFRDQQDGSLFFYKKRRHIGTIPDIISSVSHVDADALVSRLRAEGLKISEIMDAALIRQIGNIFATVNARHANSVAETRGEAQLLIDEAWRNAQMKRYAMVPYPALQPGDAATFSDGSTSDMIVRSQTITIGLNGTNLVCDMEAQVAPYERP